MADTWYVEYSFKQHVTFHEGFKTICVVPCRPLRQLSCQPARCLFWTASRRQMSRASRPAHSQCSAIGQNCRCRLVSSFVYSIFHLPHHMVDPYIISYVGYHPTTLDPSRAKSERHRSWRLEARPRPPVLDARPPLRRDWWGKARGCPSPACLQRSWWFPAPGFVLWLDPPF